MNKYEAIEKLAIAARVAKDDSPIRAVLAALVAKEEEQVGLAEALALRHAYGDDFRAWDYVEPYFYSIIDGLKGKSEPKAKAKPKPKDDDIDRQRFANAAKMLRRAFTWSSHEHGYPFWADVEAALLARAGSVKHVPATELPAGKAEQCREIAKTIMSMTWAKQPEGFWSKAYTALMGIAFGEQPEAVAKDGSQAVRNAGYIAELARRVMYDMTWYDLPEGEEYWGKVHKGLERLADGASAADRPDLKAHSLLDRGILWEYTAEGHSFWSEVYSKLKDMDL